MKTTFEYSAGGILLTTGGRLVVVQTTDLAGRPVVTLPKGLVEPGESTLEGARREVIEETGLEATITDSQPAGVLQYWFVRDRVRVRKRVTYFRMAAAGGNTADHDDEIDEVLVLEPGMAVDLLSYRSERRLVRKALEL